MNRTKIEWVKNPDGSPGFTWNPLVGCTHGCDYCWARKQAKRFKHRCDKCYRFIPHLHEERLNDPLKRKEPSTIFVCSMGDLLCEEVTLPWQEKVIAVCEKCPQHKFLILSKNPRAAYAHRDSCLWSYLEPNICMGTTITHDAHSWDRLWDIRHTGVWGKTLHFVSFEPLLGPIESLKHKDLACWGINWVIIGGQTGKKFYPPKKWVMPIVEEAKRLDIPVFMKPNLGSAYEGQLIQEFPKELVNVPHP